MSDPAPRSPRPTRTRLLAWLTALVLAACGGGGGGAVEGAASTGTSVATGTTDAGSSGSATSPVITEAPVITTQPADAQAQPGASPVFSVLATGSHLGYQWQTSTDGGATWITLDGLTDTGIVVNSATLGNDGQLFRAVVTATADDGSQASTTSSAARLTVAAAVLPTAITWQPYAATVALGGSARFSVTATGTNLAYQWQSGRDGLTWADIAGADQSTLTLNGVAAADSGQLLRVRITGAGGTVTSDSALLTVNPEPAAPVITVQPVSGSAVLGASLTFSVVVQGSPAPTLQWQASSNGGATWTNVAGGTGSSLTVRLRTASSSGVAYRVKTSNASGVVYSQAAVYTVSDALAAPSFSTQPASLAVLAGSSASFTASAAGNPQPSLQWQLSTDGGVSWANIAGETGTTLSFVTSAGDNGRQLRVLASNSQGSVASAAASLTVTGSSASGGTVDAAAMLALARAKACLACHAIDRTLVGPSFQSVATRYRGQTSAPALLASRILDGSTGRWGAIPMPANRSTLTESEALGLAQWVLSQ